MHKTSHRSVGAATASLFVLGAAQAALYRFFSRAPVRDFPTPEFIGLMLGAGILYLVAVYLVERFPLGASALWIILVGAVVFRVQLLPRPPTLSTDVYRYQWEGRVERAGINPFTVYPDMPAVRWAEDPRHPLDTARSTPTLYPPLSEMLFAFVGTGAGYKRVFTALDLASVVLLIWLLRLAQQPLQRVLTYAWNPTVIVAFSMCGHHDSLAILTLLAANLFIIGGWPRLSIAFLGLSFLSKLFPVVFLPAFLKRTRASYAAIFAGVALLGYLPYASAGRNLFRGLSDFAAGWEGNDSALRVIRWAGNSKAQAELVAGVLLVTLMAYALKKAMEPLRAGLFLTAVLLLLSPNAFPWYFTWSVPFLCFSASAPWLLMSVLCVLGYSPVIAYSAGQPYRDSTLVLALEYLPVYAWLVFEGWRMMRRQKPPG